MAGQVCLDDRYSAFFLGRAVYRVDYLDRSFNFDDLNDKGGCIFVVDAQADRSVSDEGDDWLLEFLRRAQPLRDNRFLLFIEPKRLARISERLESEFSDFSLVSGLTADGARTITKKASLEAAFSHVYAGCRLNGQSMDHPEEVLPWLTVVKGVKTFIWLDGPLQKDIDLDDLRPCGGLTPKDGDYNLFDGAVYWVGTYMYRDSINAQMCLLRGLSCMIFELSEGLSEKDRKRLEMVSDMCNGYSVPHAVLDSAVWDTEDTDWYRGEYCFDLEELLFGDL